MYYKEGSKYREETCHGGSGCCSQEHSCECGVCQAEQGHHHEECEFSHHLLELADEAWMEVLKEKMKEQILANNGKNLEKLAKVVTESNGAIWKHRMGVKQAKKDYAAKMCEVFSEKK